VTITQRLRREVADLAVLTAFFGSWIGALVCIKTLLLAEYHIQFHGMVAAAIGTVILAKVVLVAEHVSLGAWIRTWPAWVDVVLRTALYGLGVVLVLLVEKGFEGRHEYGGLGPALRAVFERTDIHHVWTTSIGVTGALLAYNGLAVIRRNLGRGALLRMFLSPLPPESST